MFGGAPATTSGTGKIAIVDCYNYQVGCLSWHSLGSHVCPSVVTRYQGESNQGDKYTEKDMNGLPMMSYGCRFPAMIVSSSSPRSSSGWSH